MKGELSFTRHPRGTYLAWGAFYAVILVIIAGLFVHFTGEIRTYKMPTGAVTLQVPYKTYVVGEPITFTLTNGYNSTIYITNSCPGEPLAVYRRVDDTWKRIHDKTDPGNCPEGDRQVKVAAGGQQAGSYAEWKNLFAEPGKYRVVAYVEYFDIAPYQDFEIITKPVQPSPVTSKPAATTHVTVPTTRTTPTVQPEGEQNETNLEQEND